MLLQLLEHCDLCLEEQDGKRDQVHEQGQGEEQERDQDHDQQDQGDEQGHGQEQQFDYVVAVL